MLEFADSSGEERKTLFAEVILPLAIAKTYTYRVPATLSDVAAPGKRAVVQFGKSRIYTAIIYRLSETPPSLYEAKYIIDIIDDYPIVLPAQIALWEWMASYYLCSLGEVMQAALPSALKLASETRVILNTTGDFDRQSLSDKEFMVLDALEIHSELKVSDISKLLGQKTVFPLLRGLFEKNVVLISEEVVEKYKPRTKSFIRLNPLYSEPDSKRALFEVLERAPRQLDILLAYLKAARSHEEISKSELAEMSGASPSALKQLIEKEIFIQESRVVGRLWSGAHEEGVDFLLNEAQQQAYEQLINHYKHAGKVALLFGETSSGKTQIYIRIIESYLSSGRQVLYLLPEIALTTQVVDRLRNHFGENVGVYHSRFNDNERAEVWQKVLKGEYRLIIGARSSVFLPFRDLGLIVIDEEHETSYKQFDPAPRYHARDTAIYLAQLHSANVLLGSATPSLESFYNVKTGKYGLVRLAGRFGGVQAPLIQVVSLTEETQKKTMQSHFSAVLVKAIGETLSRKEQVILFQNRRGYTPVLLCTTCGYSPRCINCDVSLTFHKSTGKLHCHYCGYKQDPLTLCPACGSARIEQKGFGTEKIEDELQFLFPAARIARMDLDSTRTKNSFQQLLHQFEDGEIDILVGTQMIAKGLDFSNVTLIGIVSADTMLNYPDFRAFERSYQLLAQVAGRAGRRDKQGKVIIQAFNTQHRIIAQVIASKYEEMFATEIVERRNFKYPPVFRLIQLDVKHKDVAALSEITQRLAVVLRARFGNRVVGPEVPLIGRIRTYYIQTILLKMEKEGVSIGKTKDALKETLALFEADKQNKGVYIQVDVDP